MVQLRALVLAWFPSVLDAQYGGSDMDNPAYNEVHSCEHLQESAKRDAYDT